MNLLGNSGSSCQISMFKYANQTSAYVMLGHAHYMRFALACSNATYFTVRPCQAHNRLTLITPIVGLATLRNACELVGRWDEMLKAVFQVSETSFPPPTSWRLLVSRSMLIRIPALALCLQVLSCLFHSLCSSIPTPSVQSALHLYFKYSATTLVYA